MHDERFLRGIQCFNNGEFFAAHDLIEDLWRETVDETKPFLQGLVQIAVAFHHYRRDNFGGACREFRFAFDLIEDFQGTVMGISVPELLNLLRRGMVDVCDQAPQPFEAPTILVDGQRPHVPWRHPPELLAAVDAFNAARYVDARSAFEALARSEDSKDRELFAWLASCAATLIDRSAYAKARRLLDRLPDSHRGIDIVAFSGAMERYVREGIIPRLVLQT